MNVGDTVRVIASDDLGQVYKVEDMHGRRKYWLDLELGGAINQTVTARHGHPIKPSGPYDEEQLEP